MAPLKPKIWLRCFMAAAIQWTQGIGLYAGESSLWDARRTTVRRLHSESSASSTNPAKTLLAALPGPSSVAWDGASEKRSLSTRDAVAALVAGHGWVREAHLAPRPGAPVIVHFQDAHGIEEAQRNLSVMVGRWSAANPNAPVALEGASGPIDVGGLRNFPNRSITGDIAEFLLRRGLIAGPEHAALTLEKTPDFLGAEDNALYRQNVDALRAARTDTRATARWRLFQESLDRLENRLASPTLRAFDRRSRDYDAGRSSLGDFLLYLSDLKLSPPPSTPNMDSLLKTLSLEKSLDFKAVEAQRRRLVETLVERLPRAALEDMAALGFDHRAGRLGPAAYHRALGSACRAHGIDLRRYAPLPAYIDYLERTDRIDRSALLSELESRRRFVQDALARTESERALVALSRDLALLEKTFAHALAPEDWRRYQSRRPALLTLAARTRALDPAADLVEFSPADLKPFEDFCALALRRNGALSQNLLAAVSARNAHAGLLVAGGFHTDGLTDLWRKNGVSYVVVAPALSEVPSENAYLDILSRDPLPIEKMIAGERVYLSRPIALAAPGVARTFYFALQHLLQNGLSTVRDAGVTLSRTPLRGGTAFQIGGTALFARFGEASDRWAARARAWGRRWADNFSPAAADRGGMMFWLPRLWNAATPKAWHINARQYRFLSVPVEAGFAGAMAWATVAAFGMPLDFDIFVRLSLAHYAAFHLLDFLTRDRRRAPFNSMMAGLIATLPDLFYALPPDWTSQAGITPAHLVYGAFFILHAATNGLLIRGRRSLRPVSPESVTLVPAERPIPQPVSAPMTDSPSEGVFRDRRAPAPPTPVPPTPNDRRDQTTGPGVFGPTPALTVPARLRPSPHRPNRRSPPTESILKERLVSALFSLSGSLPRKSLLKFRVDNLRTQVDAYPAAGPFYRTLVAAWENGIERTILLSSWSRRRALRISLEHLPIPVVIQGLHLVLEMRDGVPAVLFPNGQFVAPLDAQDPAPVVVGRGLLSQILKTPELDLLDFSKAHFRFWQKEGHVFLEDLSTNGTVVALPEGSEVPFEESTQFADTVDGTRFHSTRRHYLGGLLMAGFLITALLLAPVDIASAATLVPLDGGGLKAIVEKSDTLWGILDIAEGGRAAEILSRVSEVAQLNNLVNPNLIFPGQEIILRAGETVSPAVAEALSPAVENFSAAAPVGASLPAEWVDPLRNAVRQPLNPAPWLAAGVGLALTAILGWGRARRARTPTPEETSDTSFLDSRIQWDDVVDFQDPVAAIPVPAPQQDLPRLGSTVPLALTVVALGRWARRALTQSLHTLWRAPLRGALALFRAASNLTRTLIDTPRRWLTRHEKRRVDYDDPSTFFSHTRTDFDASAEISPPNTPTRFRRFAATFYGWLTRRPLAVREGNLVPAAALGTDRLPVAPTTDGTAVLAIGPNDQPLGEYTFEPPPRIDGQGPELTLEALAAMHQETSGDPAAAAVARADRALAAETGALAEKWQDEGLFAIPSPLLTYGDGDRVLIEIPFSRAAVKSVKRRLAAHKWLGVPLGKDLGTVLTSLYNDGWLRDTAGESGGNTPAHMARRLAALFRNGQSGAVLYDTPSEKLLVNISAPTAWPFFFKLWWRGSREANPRGQRWTNRQEQTFFGPNTLRFPSGEPLVTQIEAGWGIHGAPHPENIHLGALDAVAEYALIHFSQDDLSTFAGRDRMPEEEAKRLLVDSLREETRDKVLQAFAAAAQRALALGAPATVGLELSLALSWRMEDVAVNRGIRQRLAPQIVLIRTALSDAAARTASRSSRTPSITGERPAPPPAFGAVPGRWAMAARSTLERLPFIGPPLVNTPWLARVAAPLILALVLVGWPVWALGQTAPRATWTPSEAVMTDQIPANLLKELSKSLPPGTDMAALLRGTDPATSARLLSGAVDLLRKFEGGRFLAVLEKTRPHVVLAPRGPEAAAEVDVKNKRPILYIGGAEAQPAYLFVALVHELSHLGRSDRLRAKKISPTQDEGLALEDTARAMEFYAGLSVVRIAYDQGQINEQRWIAHRFLDGTIKAAPHVLSPREVQLLTAPLRAAVHLAERRRYPGVIYLSSKNLGGGRYEVRFRLPQSGAEIVVDVTPERVSAAPGGTAGALAMLGGIVMVRRGVPPNEDDMSTARAALLRSLLRGAAGPVRFQIPTPVFKNGDNYWGATGMDDLRRRVSDATPERLRDGHAATVVLLAGDAAGAAVIAEGRVTETALEVAALWEAGAAIAREARDRNETTVHLNLLGFDQWEDAERDRIRHYTTGLVAALQPGTALVVPVDRPGPLSDLLDAAARRGVRVRTVTPAAAPGLSNEAGQLVLASLVAWIERENAQATAAPLARGSRVIARNDEAVVPMSGFVIIAIERLSAAIAREIENLRTILTQA